eukprot:340505-Rhodomonas_salina.1
MVVAATSALLVFLGLSRPPPAPPAVLPTSHSPTCALNRPDRPTTPLYKYPPVPTASFSANTFSP